MDLPEVVADLYGLHPDGFVARRTELVARARAAGDRTLATVVAGLRKPTAGAWAVNLLARDEERQLDDLLRLGREVRADEA